MFWDLVKLEIRKILISKRLLLVLVVLAGVAVSTAYETWDGQNNYNAYLEHNRDGYRQSMQKLPIMISDLEQIKDRTKEQEFNLKQLRSELQVLEINGEPKERNFNAFDTTIDFLADTGIFFIALLIVLVVGDLFSAESSTGTIRLIYTSPTSRLKYFTVKIFTGVLYVLFLIIASSLVSLLVGGILLGFEGIGDPVEFTRVAGMPKGQFLLLEMALTTIGMLVVMLMGASLSVLFHSVAVPVVMSMAIVFAGYAAVAEVVGAGVTKFLFTTHVAVLVRLYTGRVPYVNNIPAFPDSVGFSLGILGIYAFAFLILGMVVFTRRETTI